MDITGRIRSLYFKTSDGYIGISEEDYIIFDNIVDNLIKKNAISKYLSRTFVSEKLFKWIEKKYKNDISLEQNFITYITKSLDFDIKERRISIPISYLAIDTSFTIGEVSIEFLSRELFDSIEQHYVKNLQYTEEEARNDINGLRMEFQGVVVATVTVTAERLKCVEIAKLKTEKILMLLRFFSTMSQHPQLPSYYEMMGKRMIPVSNVIIWDNGFPDIIQTIDESREWVYRVSNMELQELIKRGINIGSKLISTENINDFQKIILSAMQLFSRAVTAHYFHDKLVFTLAAIESLLLRDSNEPIAASLSLRIYYVAANELEPRKDIRNTMAGAYKLRSAYLHHGKTKEDIDLLKKTMNIVWITIRNLLIRNEMFKSRDEMFEELDNKILSGTPL